MERFSSMQMSRRAWLLAVVMVAALSLLLVLPPTAQAVEEPVALNDGLAQGQIFNDDLEVERGQVLEGDVVVYSGDVQVNRDGRIAGTLTVYSGDIEIDEGGRIDGNITSWSGDVQVNGQVGGSISAMAGDVEIGDTGEIGGDISVMAGDIKQRAGADVGGSVLRGPELNLPAAPAMLPWLNAPDAPLGPDASAVAARDGWERGPFGFVGRGLMALLLLGLFVGGAAAAAALRPAWTAQMQTVLNRQAALAFATGLIANVLMLAVIGFLYITVCLRPPGLLLALGMLALNAAGMAAVGAEIGGRASERISGQWTPTARVALGVLLPGLIVAFLWTLGGCFAFFGAAGALLLGSFGVGSILVRALNLGSGPAPAAAAAPAQPAPSTPASAAPASAAPASAAPASAAPASAAPAATAPATPAAAGGEPPAEAEAEAPPAAWWQEGSAPAEQAAPPAAPVVDAPVEPGLVPLVQADFTRIEGIGPKLNQRLHAANIRTFADLAALPPETLGGILGWTSERVLRSGLLEQARRLAGE